MKTSRELLRDLQVPLNGSDTELEASEGKSVLKDKEKRPLDPLDLL